jgi:hypothetical protein
MAKNGNVHPTRIFKKPEDLESVWIRYKANLKEANKEWEKIQYVGKDGEQRIDYPKLPLTYEGFKVFCWDEKIGTIQHYFENTLGLYDDFCDVCSRIKTEIRQDQITGGLLGFYNPSITQRLNGLVEKQEQKQEVTITGIDVKIVPPDGD